MSLISLKLFKNLIIFRLLNKITNDDLSMANITIICNKKFWRVSRGRNLWTWSRIRTLTIKSITRTHSLTWNQFLMRSALIIVVPTFSLMRDKQSLNYTCTNIFTLILTIMDRPILVDFRVPMCRLIRVSICYSQIFSLLCPQPLIGACQCLLPTLAH